MDPTKENTELEKLLEQFNTTMLNDPGAATGTISTGYADDTITLSSNTLSSNPWDIGGNTVIGGGYSYPTNISMGAGGPYTITGGAGVNTTSINPWSTYTGTPTLQLNGEGADIKVNGWSLVDAIQKIEERLNILTPNTNLEEEWEELRALGAEYRKLEQHIKDKQATWDRLKAMPPPIVE